MPNEVIRYIKTNYPKKKIKEISTITDALNIITYEVEIKDRDLIFDNNGKFSKEKMDKK